MKISKKGEYALRALTYLAVNDNRKITHIHEIALKEEIPEKFLEQILLALKNAGWLQSRRGIGGGYSLNSSPSEITMGEVIRLFDGPFSPLECIELSSHESCTKESTCGLRSVMLDVRNAVSEILDHVTLKDICNRIEGMSERRTETLMYYI